MEKPDTKRFKIYFLIQNKFVKDKFCSFFSAALCAFSMDVFKKCSYNFKKLPLKIQCRYQKTLFFMPISKPLKMFDNC